MGGTVATMSRLRVAIATVACAVAAGCGASGGPLTAADVPATFTPIADLPAVVVTTTTTTTAAASTTTTAAPPTTEPDRDTLVISGTGDVNLDPGFVRTFRRDGYEIAWSGLGTLFTDDDLTVVNLECSAGPGTVPWEKTWIFACDPAAYPAAVAGGVDVANQANNHGADYGFEAMLEGSRLLRQAGITPVGAGADRDEAFTPAFFEVDGWTVAVLGMSAVGPENGSWSAGSSRPGVASATDLDAALSAIAAADDAADVVIVTVHWGEELDVEPQGWVRRLGEAYIDAGADGVFGHHTHRLGPLTWHAGRPIAWSLGNFVWQAHPPEAVDTAVAQFSFHDDGTVGACMVPVRIESTGHPVVQGGCEPVGD